MVRLPAVFDRDRETRSRFTPICMFLERAPPPPRRRSERGARSGLRRSTHGYVMNSFYILQVNEKAAATDNRPAVQTVDRLIPHLYEISINSTRQDSEAVYSRHGGAHGTRTAASRSATGVLVEARELAQALWPDSSQR